MRTPILLTAIMLSALSFSLSGCKKERYYCDATGCYLCDGIGCRQVDPPNRPGCTGDFECGPGETCTSAGCTDTCTGDTDCPRGTVCRETEGGRLCLSPNEEEPTPNPGVCTRNSDCDPPNVICIDGMCTRDTSCGPGGCACSATNPCDEGYTCAGGSCRPDEEACHFNEECGAGRICVDGGCYQSCSVASCPGGFMCDDNDVCVEVPPPVDECASNDECPSSWVCVDSSCRAECTTGVPCPSGYYCSNSICRVDDRPRPFCTAANQASVCASGSVCLNGVCRASCSTDTQCSMISVSLPYCFENYCSTFNQANSNCATSVDCAATQVCINGLCN